MKTETIVMTKGQFYNLLQTLPGNSATEYHEDGSVTVFALLPTSRVPAISATCEIEGKRNVAVPVGLVNIVKGCSSLTCRVKYRALIALYLTLQYPYTKASYYDYPIFTV